MFGWLVGFWFSRQGFSVALEPVLELAPVDEAGLRLTEIHLPLSLPPERWDSSHAPPPPLLDISPNPLDEERACRLFLFKNIQHPEQTGS